jgi:succinoglycan biosynthesis protein ExoM
VNETLPHISVCICTFKRREFLIRLVNELKEQETAGLFTYSIVVADNDPERSAEPTVAALRAESTIAIKYCTEPNPGIAWARNKVVSNAQGDYLAFIDDDEFPCREWLLTLFEACGRFGMDGVFGPVRRHFDTKPPAWLLRSHFYDRRVNPTGMRVEWPEARTGNVFFKRKILGDDLTPFRPQFRVGEDQDFFRRKMEQGFQFVWCAEAVAYETVPPFRWKRSYLIKKALLRGACAALQPSCGTVSVVKSIAAVPLYAIALPVTLFLGQHHFMTTLVKGCDHLGKLLALAGYQPIKDAYVAEGTGA